MHHLIVRSAVGATSAALAVLVFSFEAGAQASADLRAVSATVALGKHERAVPVCPAGQKFFLTHVQASPVVGSPPEAELAALKNARWVVKVGVQNPDDNDPATTEEGAQLLAAGLGVTHTETSIPSGQWLAPHSTTFVFSINLLDPTPAASPNAPGPLFNVHISGFCGVRA